MPTELEILKKKYVQLNVAFENVDQERMFLREQLRIMHEVAGRILEVPRHYEGQNNVSVPSDAGPVLVGN